MSAAADAASGPIEIDARGLLCPLPVLRLRKRLAALPEGTEVVLVATDAAAALDVPHFCAEAGHVFLGADDNGPEGESGPGACRYRVRRGAGH